MNSLEIAELPDLAQFGISMAHENGTCYVCGKSTIGFSDGTKLDSTCAEHYSIVDTKWAKPENVWVVEIHNTHQLGFRYNAIVKIDGVLYYLRNTQADNYEVLEYTYVPVALNEMKKTGCNITFVSPFTLASWYAQQDMDIQNVYVLEFRWVEIKDIVTNALQDGPHWVRVPTYNMGHGGREMQELHDLVFRLYLRPSRQAHFARHKHFSVVAIQVLRESAYDTPEEQAYLPEYITMPLATNFLVLRWQQMAGHVVAALHVLENAYVDDGIARTAEIYSNLSRTMPYPNGHPEPLPYDWHIVLDLRGGVREGKTDIREMVILPAN